MEYHFYFQLFLLNLKRILNLFLFFSLLKSFLAKKGWVETGVPGGKPPGNWMLENGGQHPISATVKRGVAQAP